jgi:hypothetical protein
MKYLKESLTRRKILLYFLSEGRCAADFHRPLKSIALAGFELATLGSSGKHFNHYTTEATMNLTIM